MEKGQEEQQKVSIELDDILKGFSWKQLKTIIQEVNLEKIISVGGVRVNEKNRRFFIPAVKKKCLADEEVLSYVFSLWFNKQKAYYDSLKDFFQSLVHGELLKERGVDTSKYVLNDEFFGEFISILKLTDVDKFLLLSPICFTPTQKEQLEQFKK